MAVQTIYNETLEAGREGAIADMATKTLLSRVVETAAVGFGKPVVQGSADNGARLSTTGDTAILGISVRERSTVSDQFAVGDNMRVLTQGSIWVKVAATVAAGDPVHVIVASATFSNAGGVAITGALYETSAASGELAKVRIA